jgi:hypothetical protein
LCVFTGASVSSSSVVGAVPLYDMFGQPTNGEPYPIMDAAEWARFRQHQAMVAAMPDIVGDLPIRTGVLSVLQHLGDMSKLQPGQFNSRFPALLEMSNTGRAASQKLGLELDKTIHGKIHLVNSMESVAAYPVPSLWEYLRLLSLDEERRRTHSASVKLPYGTVSAERTTPHFHAESCHSQTGRGILSWALLQKLNDLSPAEVLKFAQELYNQVLDIHKAAVLYETGADATTYNIQSLLTEKAVAVLLTYPRRPGLPTLWQADSTNACSIPIEPVRAKKRERAAESNVMDDQLSVGVTTISGIFLNCHTNTKRCYIILH